MRTSLFLHYILLHQLQEGFGWDPFIHLFSDYQKMSTIPKDNPSKMNLWARKFSQQVNKNLAPFFTAWGWPIKKELSVELSSLPSWEQVLFFIFCYSLTKIHSISISISSMISQELVTMHSVWLISEK